MDLIESHFASGGHCKRYIVVFIYLGVKVLILHVAITIDVRWCLEQQLNISMAYMLLLFAEVFRGTHLVSYVNAHQLSVIPETQHHAGAREFVSIVVELLLIAWFSTT